MKIPEMPKFYEERVVDHEIRCVTPDMIDWFWVNMEKCYPLWHPKAHKVFAWEVPPSKVGHVGSIHIDEQVRDGVLHKGHSRREDVSSFPVQEAIIYEHVYIQQSLDSDNKPNGHYILHQYEATSYGTRMHSSHWLPGTRPPGAIEASTKHNQEEGRYFSEFLPQLYSLWQAVNDPAVNVQCSLKVKRLPDGRHAYVTPQTRAQAKSA